MRLAGASLEGFNHILVTRALDAISRRKDHVSNKKDAILALLLRAALQAIGPEHNELMVRAAVLLMFYGALRQSEVALPRIRAFDPLLHLTRADIQVGEQLTVTIKAGKNLQKHDQRKISTLSPTGDPLTCPLDTVKEVLRVTPELTPERPTARICRQSDAYSNVIPSGRVGTYHEKGRGRPHPLLAAQPQKGISNTCPFRRVFRLRGPAARGLVVQRVPNVHTNRQSTSQ